jgi:hypothetical protein
MDSCADLKPAQGFFISNVILEGTSLEVGTHFKTSCVRSAGKVLTE